MTNYEERFAELKAEEAHEVLVSAIEGYVKTSFSKRKTAEEFLHSFILDMSEDAIDRVFGVDDGEDNSFYRSITKGAMGDALEALADKLFYTGKIGSFERDTIKQASHYADIFATIQLNKDVLAYQASDHQRDFNSRRKSASLIDFCNAILDGFILGNSSILSRKERVSKYGI